ncbi:hypothetical protein [Vibrio splendidus]|uniref:hypothetical protein n=1 Tax=Vibrio splendidus TaxID=29497 RepID=UPI001E2859EB|nr:hypothetical protein [Vibrio splendidus]MCC4859337.1 hypothetical protein [Vibrio splendidus]
MDAPQTSELYELATSIIPVVSGALIALVGALVGSNYTHRLNSNANKLAERRSKLELIVIECFEISVWLKKQENYYFFGSDETIEQSPMAKIAALNAIYFEELDEQVNSLSNAEICYRSFLVEGAKLKLEQDSNAPSIEHLNKTGEVHSNLIAERDSLVQAARKLMKTLSEP